MVSDISVVGANHSLSFLLAESGGLYSVFSESVCDCTFLYLIFELICPILFYNPVKKLSKIILYLTHVEELLKFSA